METYDVYTNRVKPDRAPEPSIFGQVWSILYMIIFLSYGYVGYMYWKKQIPKKVLVPFGINLIGNALFTWLQFGLQNQRLAAIDIIIVLLTIPRTMKIIRPYNKRVARAQIPYLIWLMIATTLQISILFLN